MLISLLNGSRPQPSHLSVWQSRNVLFVEGQLYGHFFFPKKQRGGNSVAWLFDIRPTVCVSWERDRVCVCVYMSELREREGVCVCLLIIFVVTFNLIILLWGRGWGVWFQIVYIFGFSFFIFCSNFCFYPPSVIGILYRVYKHTTRTGKSGNVLFVEGQL